MIEHSYCKKLHLSKQAYIEFYDIDNIWVVRSIKKYENRFFKYLKMVIEPNMKFILDSEKLGTYWGYKCLDEYKEDCDKAKGCTLSNTLSENAERREKLAKCVHL